MWAQYSKTFLFNQIVIVIACAVVQYVKGKVSLTLTLFVAMELGAMCGAWWGAKLKRTMAQAKDKLPLDRG